MMALRFLKGLLGCFKGLTLIRCRILGSFGFGLQFSQKRSRQTRNAASNLPTLQAAAEAQLLPARPQTARRPRPRSLGLRLRVQGWGFRVEVEGSGLRVEGLGVSGFQRCALGCCFCCFQLWVGYGVKGLRFSGSGFSVRNSEHSACTTFARGPEGAGLKGFRVQRVEGHSRVKG